MRFTPKYSLLRGLYQLAPFFVPNRLSRFRRSKWLRFQRLERKLPRRRFFVRRFKRGGRRRKQKKILDNRASKLFVTYRSKRCALHKWNRTRFLYKNSLQQKRRLLVLHDSSVGKRIYAKILNNKNQRRLHLFTHIFVRPEFRLDMVLWRLQFYKSPYESQCAVRTGKVFVNGNCVKSLYYLNEGDIVSVRDSVLFRNVTKKYRLVNFLPLFFEVDYYTQTFVVLKHWGAVSFDDANVFLRAPFSLSLLRFFFSK